MKTFILKPGQLSLSQIISLYYSHQRIEVDAAAKEPVLEAQTIVNNYVNNDIISYGINTGFGKLATSVISRENINELQRNLVLSHATGVGSLLSEKIVKIILLLKINTLAQGYSGVRWEVIEHLVKLMNAGITPCIPAKGSVGASGDLAPLAHLACTVIGEGEAILHGIRMSASAALKKSGLSPLVLAPKEGLALVNGTQVSCALALEALIGCHRLFDSAIFAGSLSLEATKSGITSLDTKIHALRRLEGQSEVAAAMRILLKNSPIRGFTAHSKVQDPYSLRCQPQVMGACLEQLRYAASLISNEINAVTDNPLVFAREHEIMSGGNFHGQVLAFAADAMAPVISTIGNISERRIALLMDPSFSGLPAFLVKDSGLNSGFMVAHVTAAALASENKVLAHPASVDSIPTSANQEDHVSMATFAAKRLGEMIENSVTIVAIELLCASQGLDFLLPMTTSPALEPIYTKIRSGAAFYKVDRYFATDIVEVKRMLDENQFLLSSQLGAEVCSFF